MRIVDHCLRGQSAGRCNGRKLWSPPMASFAASVAVAVQSPGRAGSPSTRWNADVTRSGDRHGLGDERRRPDSPHRRLAPAARASAARRAFLSPADSIAGRCSRHGRCHVMREDDDTSLALRGSTPSCAAASSIATCSTPPATRPQVTSGQSGPDAVQLGHVVERRVGGGEGVRLARFVRVAHARSARGPRRIHVRRRVADQERDVRADVWLLQDLPDRLRVRLRRSGLPCSRPTTASTTSARP